MPKTVRRHAERVVRAYCAQVVPEANRAEERCDVVVRANTMTMYVYYKISASGPEVQWSRMAIAQFRYDGETRLWTLYWADRTDRWYLCDDVNAVPTIEPLLSAMMADTTGVFWG